ncbi:hypothetical protein TREMEDRAFT_74701 [Tremella mesenterica DSM 1558]|uniref:uncharacterized protein n=1 Tax=Tremella mesenterica (strain ATCC 24925 / CBS 8224 / DSM 1558 / NBRC 9311 / NRRL Y-6157 / RJB 2259-6 / UBC 559-6) TaxID=578456 RepID=UPI00032C44A7|nr:uncharacterized protein TREMEDRAFT_74701 [Tremella mesenterica DSM 1558]EIW66425.1 hypothetical protein TREMEDRAFT_74701 [Tremella mesenterica DSM 1558]
MQGFTTSSSTQRSHPHPHSHSSPHLTPTFHLLLSSFALTASKSWVSDTGQGGTGWLVLTYWGWKIGRTIRLTRSRRIKGKAREVDSRSFNPSQIRLALAQGFESVLFFSTLTSVGPLRTLIVTVGATAIRPIPIWKSSEWARIPLFLATTVIILQPVFKEDYITTLTVLSLLITSLTSRWISSKTLLGRDINRSRDDPEGQLSSLLAGSTVILLTFLLSVLKIFPQPWPSLDPNSHQFLPYAAALLAARQPLPIRTTGATSTDFESSHSRDTIILLLVTAALQFFAFPPNPSSSDILLLLPLTLITLVSLLSTKRDESRKWSSTQEITTNTSFSLFSIIPPTWRPHLRTILNTSSSSKIFYFLLLNLAYMAVQMAYGVLTNSLAIHMLFDCLGLAVGLWASVAATWKPDGLYTFGYSRVETLSGFANGESFTLHSTLPLLYEQSCHRSCSEHCQTWLTRCFLILVSLSIIFEGIQRIFNPPTMDTRKLLLVSSIGLAINLWGMWATGGHHHHGHGHGHEHSHDHTHGIVHIDVNEKKLNVENHSTHAGHHVGHDHNVHSHEKHNYVHQSNPSTHPTYDPQEPIMAHNHANCKHDNHTYEPNGHTRYHDHDNHEDDHGHDHGHDHDKDHSHEHHDHSHSHNMRGVFLHVLADTLGSVGVIISTLLIKFTGWTGWDPLASLFIAALIMASVIPLVVDSAKVLCLDVGVEKESEIRAALSELSSIEGLQTYSSPRFWPRCEGSLVGSIHIRLSPSPSSVDHTSSTHIVRPTIYADIDRVVNRVERLLKSKIKGLDELVVQVEGSDERGFCTCMTG